jgi:hypothetical protein
MRRMLCLGGLAVLVIWGGQAGCHKPAVREKPLPDPLLTSKKPIEGKPHVTDAGPPPHDELPPPPPRPPDDREAAPAAPEVPVVQLLGPRRVP